MEAWDDALVELQREYLRGCIDRLRRMDLCLALIDRSQAVSATPAETTSEPVYEPLPDADLRSFDEALADLHHELHSLAGSGAIYGLPAVSQLAGAGERRCLAIRERAADLGPAAGVVGPADVADLRRTVDSIRAQLAATASSSAGVAERSTAPAPASAASAASAHVLVVDADSSARRRLVGDLEAQGLPCRTADTRAAALASLAELPPAALVVAAQLADGSGYELTEEVRALAGRSQGVRLPVLIEGPAVGHVDKVEAIRCGADGWFEAWAGSEEPVRLLRQLLQARRGATRVLSIEDDPEQAAYLRAVLESAGYEFHCTEDPAAFDEDLAAFRPDLVLMDVLLPGATGYELARRVRQEVAREALPILFLTTEGQLSARVESARVGGDDHLTKPVAPELLLAAVAARLARSEKLHGLLDRDGLTGLLNQTAFLERARRVVDRKAREPRRRTAWVMLDLDHFKSVNDRFGHPAGDGVLVALGALLGRRLRPTDAAARYGGEEFSILLDDLGERDAVRLMDRLREEFQAVEHIASPDAAFRVSFSAGVAFLRPGMGLDEWREGADRVLYRAKARGRNQVALAVAPFPPLPGVELEPRRVLAVA